MGIFTKLTPPRQPLRQLLLKDVVSEWGWEPDYTIYVRTPAKEAWERLSKRDRSCEESVPVSLLQQLEKRHDEFIENGQCGKHIHLDGAQNRQVILDNALDIIQKIKIDARNHLDPSPRTGYPTSTTAWQCHHSQRNPVHIDHDNLASANAVPDNPDTIEVWVSCVSQPWKKVTIPRAVLAPKLRETLSSIYGILADILHVHHRTKIIAGDRPANLLQGDFIRVQLALPGGKR